MADEKDNVSLADEILAEAKTQADRKLSGAKKTGEKLVQSAHTQSKAAADEIMKAAEKRLEHDAALITAGIPHQRQVKKLQVMDEVVESILQSALDSFEKLSGDKSLQVIENLASEAAQVVGGDSVTIELQPKDIRELSDKLKSSLQKKRPNLAVELKEMAAGSGGVIVRSADGTKMADNTYVARMRRMRAELRDQLASIIFGENK